jgi:hypothetical protein
LFAESVAAHQEARRLDPNVPTGLEQTLLMAGDLERLLGGERLRVGGGGDDVIRVIALGLAGRREEALQRLSAMRGGGNIKAFQDWVRYLTSWLERRRQDMMSEILTFSGLRIMEDPEAMFQEAWLLCEVGEHERGLAQLERSIAKGYFVAGTLAESIAFAGVRGDARFQELLARAESGRQQALLAFREADGDRLVGLTRRP